MARFFAAESDGLYIPQHANIYGFETEAEARQFLADSEADFLRDEAAAGNPLTLTVETGHFGDCWVKFHHAPTADDLDALTPFTRDDLLVQRPGTHPGGNAWWVTPIPEILVAVISPA